MSAAPELPISFVCVPWSSSQTRSGCGERHKRAKRELRHEGKRGQAHQVGNKRCAECTIGAAHARGEQPTSWPDGQPVKLIQITPASTRWLGQSSETSPSAAPNAGRALRRRAEGGLGDSGAGPGGGAGAPNQPALTDPKPTEPSAASVADTGRPAPKQAGGGGVRPPRASEGRGERAPVNRNNGSIMAKKITHAGESLTVAEWAARAGTSTANFRQRLKRGWPMANAVSGEIPEGRKARGSAAIARGGSKGKPKGKVRKTTDPAWVRSATRPNASKGDARLEAALELIDERRQALLESVAELERTANALAALAGKAAPYPEASAA